jgi:hypothetical protein
MRKTALLAILLPGVALAQVSASAQIRVDLPVVLPSLVVVSPGIQVVPEQPTEVFFVGGWYYTRHGNGWIRSRNHQGGWVVVQPASVPPGLAKLPPGKYKHWKAEKHHEGEGHGNGNGHGQGNGHGNKHK